MTEPMVPVAHLPADDHHAIRGAVRDLCAGFPGEYWRALDQARAYPEDFVEALTAHGWLSVLIPEDYGGGGRGVTEAGIVLEEIHRSGGCAHACHAQMYTMGTLLRHGSEEQKRTWLPGIADGTLRLQAFAVTEPDAGSDTTSITTTAVRRGSDYVINGQKTFTSRVANSDLMLLLTRTSPRDDRNRARGLSVFLVDLRDAGGAVEYVRIPVMMNHQTFSVYFTDFTIPEANRIGEEGEGFRYILDGMNAERVLIASESVGDGRFFVERAAAYASQRHVFGRPVGANQGVQFPLAQAHAAVEAASLMRFQAAALFDTGQPCGPAANMAKLLASQASSQAADACVMAHGGYAFCAEYDVERKFREARLFEVAPVANNLVLAYIGQQVLGMPRSY